VLDNWCTQHMIGDRAMFTTFEVGGKEQEKVTFGDNSKGMVFGLGWRATQLWEGVPPSILIELSKGIKGEWVVVELFMEIVTIVEPDV
jgi:ribose 1,5-bisphosphokinase PhnN